MPLEHVRVCVIEDHDFQRGIAVDLLRQLGARDVLSAADGRAALDLLAAQAEPVDVALVDIDLPGIDGIQLMSLLAEGGKVRAVGVFSALDRRMIDSVSRLAGETGLRVLGAIEKPLSSGKLAALLGPLMRDAEDVAPQSPEFSAEALRAAIDGNQIQPHFQLKVALGSGQVVGAEALARWPREGSGARLPAQFVPAFERAGLGAALDERLLDRAAHWRGVWARRGLDIDVSVNLGADLLRDPDVVERCLERVRRHGEEPSRFVLEIAESRLLGEASLDLLTALARLRLKGFGLAIDTFGNSRFALEELRQIPFTEIKIDRSLVQAATEGGSAAALFDAGVLMARRLHLSVTAVGVETPAQWQRAADRGCDQAQGFLIASPARGEELALRAERWHAAGIAAR